MKPNVKPSARSADLQIGAVRFAGIDAPTWKSALRGLALLLSAALSASGQTPSTNRVWPPPPEPPRIAYVQSFAQPADVGARQSGFRRFANWFSGASKGNEKFSRPFGVAVDDQGNLCLTDTGANTVAYYDAAKKQWRQWDRIGKVRFAAPVSVAKKGNTLFVADSARGAVVAFDIDGKRLFEISGDLERPAGVAVQGERLAVVDSQRHCVLIYDLRGRFISRFGKRGIGPGEFNFPTHVAADGGGRWYVTDSMNHRVQLFDAAGRFESQLGSAGDGPGYFSRPKGVAVDTSGHVYVVDALFSNVQIFDRAGRLLLDLGGPGGDAGEFYLPNGIAIGGDNRIYVADSYNHRVQVLRYVGAK